MPLPDDVLEQIDEQYRDHNSLKDFENLGELAKSYVETKAMVGNSIRIPGKDAGDDVRQEYLQRLVNNDPELMFKPDFESKEQSQEFFRTIGLPSEFSKYENPEGLNLEEGVEAELRELLYAAKVPQAGYEKIMASFSDRQNQTTTMNQELREGDMGKLKEKWGMATEDRLAAAQQANEDFYPGREFDSLTGKERESLYNISVAMTGKGAQAATQEGGTVNDVMTPDQANLMAEEMMTRARKNKNGELTREEVMGLMKRGMELKEKYSGYEMSLDSMRA